MTAEYKGIRIASRKNKARNLQKYVRDLIIRVFPVLTLDDVRSCSMGSGGKDIQLSQMAKDLFPFSVECKNLKAFAGYKFYDQAMFNRTEDEIPLVVVKANGRKPLALIDVEFFIELVGCYGGQKEIQKKKEETNNKG